MEDMKLLAALERHWTASDMGDFVVEHEIYLDDAVLEYPQSGERIRGRERIRESRANQPNKKRFTVRRIVGAGELWISECTMTYDDAPTYMVSIMEFRDGMVSKEVQYFGEAFAPSPTRARFVERFPT